MILKQFPLGFPWKTQDPFLFCVHHLDAYPKGNKDFGPDSSYLKNRNIGQDFDPQLPWRMYHGEKVPGFPAHPHRGFETVTIATKGFIDHSDSLGAAGRFGDGDVQWMTAGKGVQHCEMFPLLNQNEDNPLELFQIWLNLPKKDKLANPYFKMLWNSDIPVLALADKQGKKYTIKLVAGSVEKHQAPTPPPNSWANNQHNDVAIWLIKTEAGTTITLPPASTQVNRSLYFYEGNEIKADGMLIKVKTGLELDASTSFEFENGNVPASFLLLQGKPIAEPVAQHGPFVMNSQQEIMQAFAEYQQTQFGGWPWSSYEHVHKEAKNGFALYPDGKKEERPTTDPSLINL
ncbi:MAG: pirin family protein [Chryseotalea sp.]|jgi:redox-sensitive bicupin YhaK (pirin superfamily)